MLISDEEERLALSGADLLEPPLAYCLNRLIPLARPGAVRLAELLVNDRLKVPGTSWRLALPPVGEGVRGLLERALG